MTRILMRLGFRFAQLGAPLCDSEIVSNRRLYWLYTVAGAAVFVGGLLACLLIGSLAGSEAPGGIFGVFCGLAILGGMLVTLAIDAAVGCLTNPAPISGHACLALKEAVEKYPEVRRHVDAINQQARAIRECDYSLLREWVAEAEWQARIVEAERACRALHGIEVQ